MLGYLLRIIISFLMQVLLHKPKKRMKRAEGQTGLDAEMLDDLCQSSSDLLKSKGVETLMLRDFTFSHHLPEKTSGVRILFQG